MRTADAGELRGHLAGRLAVGAQLMLNKMYLFELAHFREQRGVSVRDTGSSGGGRTPPINPLCTT